jgi:3D (Asp-Asp-Asp) domain-containing protein
LGISATLYTSSSAIAQQSDEIPQSSPSTQPEESDTPADDTAEATDETDPAQTERLAGSVSPRLIARTFTASAYSIRGRTATGVPVRQGIIAADPRVLPLGSIVRLHAGKYSGLYTVMDTGGAIRGQRIDIFFPSRAEALRFGRKKVKVEVLRHGWDPSDDIAEGR